MLNLERSNKSETENSEKHSTTKWESRVMTHNNIVSCMHEYVYVCVCACVHRPASCCLFSILSFLYFNSWFISWVSLLENFSAFAMCKQSKIRSTQTFILRWIRRACTKNPLQVYLCVCRHNSAKKICVVLLIRWLRATTLQQGRKRRS